MIKAVSQLISEEVGIGSSRFQHSLSVINTYAVSDKGMQVNFHDQIEMALSVVHDFDADACVLWAAL